MIIGKGIEIPHTSYETSIGTGFSLETVYGGTNSRYDDEREIVPVKLDNYSCIYYNVLTLVRNLTSSLKKDDRNKLSAYELADIVSEEILLISSIHNTLNTKTKIRFYYKDYGKELSNKDKEKQLQTMYMIESTAKIVYGNQIETILTKIPLEGEVLVFTHMSLDLLDHSKYRKFDLLESHTGTVRSHTTWNNKYIKLTGKDFLILPFNKILLNVFGSKDKYVSGIPLNLRKETYNILNKYKTTPLKTENYIRDLLMRQGSEELKSVLVR